MPAWATTAGNVFTGASIINNASNLVDKPLLTPSQAEKLTYVNIANDLVQLCFGDPTAGIALITDILSQQ